MFIFATSQPHGIAIFQPVTPSGSIQQWTRPPGVRILRRAFLVAGGGGGGNNEGQPVPKGGGGGGGGEVALMEFFPLPAGSVTWDIVVALGGAAATFTLPAEAGEASTVSGIGVPGTTITAAGGEAGNNGVAFSSGGPGGAGGLGGTSVSPPGQPGQAGGSSVDGFGVSRFGGGGGGGGGWNTGHGLGGLHALTGSPAPSNSAGGGILDFLAAFGGFGSDPIGVPGDGNGGLVILEW